jgi:hypothetical protein
MIREILLWNIHNMRQLLNIPRRILRISANRPFAARQRQLNLPFGKIRPR